MLVVHSSRFAAVSRTLGFVCSCLAATLLGGVFAGKAKAVMVPTPWQVKHERVLREQRDVVHAALKQRGVPYRWGGESRSGFDCSGLVRYAYRRIGMTLPHYTVSQSRLGVAVRHGALRPGDLLFFHGLGHVGLYIGRGLLVHAPHRGTRVRVASLASYGSQFDGARRLIR